MHAYAVQTKQKTAYGKSLSTVVPVVHEFSSRAERKEWVMRGRGKKGEAYRYGITTGEAKKMAAQGRGGGPSSMVRHLNIEEGTANA